MTTTLHDDSLAVPAPVTRALVVALHALAARALQAAESQAPGARDGALLRLRAGAVLEAHAIFTPTTPELLEVALGLREPDGQLLPLTTLEFGAARPTPDPA